MGETLSIAVLKACSRQSFFEIGNATRIQALHVFFQLTEYRNNFKIFSTDAK